MRARKSDKIPSYQFNVTIGTEDARIAKDLTA
jgi:hypothetical protein